MSGHHRTMPIAMGAMMGAMMLMPLHAYLTGEARSGALGALVFVLLHVAVAAGAMLAVLLWPRARLWVRSHKPDGAAISRMSLAALASATTIHLIHGMP